jgi:hypothetical protein
VGNDVKCVKRSNSFFYHQPNSCQHPTIMSSSPCRPRLPRLADTRPEFI